MTHAMPDPTIPYLNALSAAEVGRKSGSNFLASFRFLNPDQRAALSAAYAFFRIADDCVDELPDPDDKRRALGFWREELSRAYHGTPSHPVMRELQAATKRYRIPEEDFAGLVHGCEMDIDKTRYETMAELTAYCHLVAGLVGRVCLRIFGYDAPDANELAEELGLAFQLTNIVRDVGADLKLGRIYLPRDVLAHCGYAEDELKARIENDAFFRVMEFFHDEAARHYAAGMRHFSNDNAGKLRAVAVMAAVYRAILNKTKRENYPVLRKKVSLSRFEKFKLVLPLLWNSLW
jgi:phytoene synthase